MADEPSDRNLPLLEAAVRDLPTGFVLLDPSGDVIFCNPALAMLLGRDCQELEGLDFFREVVPAADVEVGAAYRQGMEDGILDRDMESVFGATTEQAFDVRVRMRRIEHEEAAYGVLVVDDNTRLKRTERAIEAALVEAQDQATRDPLTGLYNRRFIEMILPSELSRAQRHGSPTTLCIVDVDHFKLINDRFGHPMGDKVLMRLAGVMQRMRRVSDTCARIGGEEFCLLLPHTTSAAALPATERLHRVIRALRFEEVSDLRVTVSIGVATTPMPIPQGAFDTQMRQLLAKADEALYEAKRGGRDRTVVKD